MNQLYPIIRRARRSLWPEGEPRKETKVSEAEAAEEKRPDCERVEVRLPIALTLDPSPPGEGNTSPADRANVAVSEPTVVAAVKDQSGLTSAATGASDEVLPGIELVAKKTKQRGKKRSTSNAQLPTDANPPV